MYPADRTYTRDFAWIRLEGTVASVGLTNHAIEVLSDIQLVKLPAVGQTVARGKVLGSVEGLKSAMDLLAPVSGVVIEVNGTLADAPQRLQSDPHGTWLVRLNPTDLAELNDLLSNAQFEALLRSSDDASQSKPRGPANRGSAARGPTPPRQGVPPAPKAAVPPPAPSPALRIEPEKAIRLFWSVHLGGCQLKGASSGPQDRDYSGGSYFSWRERDITLTDELRPGGGRDRRYRWRETTHTRISAAGLSSSTSSNTDHAGTWEIEVAGQVPYLVLQDRDRGRLRLRLEKGARGEVLLDGQPYDRRKL